MSAPTGTALTGDALIAKTREVMENLEAGGTLQSHFDLGDDDMEAIYALAHGQFAARKYDKAADLFKFLCLCDHKEPRWFYGLGMAKQHTADYAGAAEAYGMATLLDTDDPLPQAQAGYCLMFLERWSEAQSALEGAVMACEDNEEHAALKRQAEGMLATAKAKGNLR